MNSVPIRNPRVDRARQSMRGGVVLGIFVGLILGLAIAAAIAYYLGRVRTVFASAGPMGAARMRRASTSPICPQRRAGQAAFRFLQDPSGRRRAPARRRPKAAGQGDRTPGDRHRRTRRQGGAAGRRGQARRPDVAAGRRLCQRIGRREPSRRVSRSPAGKPQSSRRRCPTRACAIACGWAHSTTPTKSIASKAELGKSGFDAAVIKNP